MKHVFSSVRLHQSPCSYFMYYKQRAFVGLCKMSDRFSCTPDQEVVPSAPSIRTSWPIRSLKKKVGESYVWTVPSEYKAAKTQTFIPWERFKLALFWFCPPPMCCCLGDKVAKNKVHRRCRQTKRNRRKTPVSCIHWYSKTEFSSFFSIFHIFTW